METLGIFPGEVKIIEEITPSGCSPTGGHMRVEGFTIDVPAEGEGYIDISFPYPIGIVVGRVNTVKSTDGDEINFEISPDTVVGNITADIAASGVVVNVSDTVIQNIQIGYFATLDDGTNNESIEVAEIDTDNNTITLREGVQNSYEAASPTYVKMTVKMIKSVHLYNDGLYTFGAYKIGGSYIPKNTVLRAKYKNVGTEAKTIYFELEYVY